MSVSTIATPTRRPRRVLPGLPGTLGFTLFYLSIIVLLPLAALVLRAADVGVAGFIAQIASPRVQAAFRASFGIAFLAAFIDTGLGLLVAWVLVRYRFWGRRLLDALVDLPIALPTAVAGISLAALYGPHGWIGGLLAPLGVKVAYTPLGVIVALTFIGLPFVVRTLEPVVRDLSDDVEEAAASLGASRVATLAKVVLPSLAPAWLTGFALAFARAVGEYGSVIFIAGNMPYRSEIAPLLIVTRLEEFDYAGASAIATVMLVISFAALLAINSIQAFSRRRYGHA